VPHAVALVPARAGSQRVPGKNVRQLAGHPLIAYSLAAAHESGVFESVVVATDSPEIADTARRYGGEVPGLRPAAISTATSPDIEWVLWAKSQLAKDGRAPELFSILRPTSPFRTAATIRRAWDALLTLGDSADSIRAVEKCRQHPAKMWVLAEGLLEPLLAQPDRETPLHSRQYQALPPVFVQNSSLEIAWSRVLEGPLPTISGRRIAPFLTESAEGFSLDYPDDFERAEAMIASGVVQLPRIEVRTTA
jgi:N-acylneuraminate cytidylyltransferase